MPSDEYEKITPWQCEEFVAQKTLEESLTRSAQYTKVAHHLGIGGYYGKDRQFRNMEKKTRQLYIHNGGVLKSCKNWMLAKHKEALKQINI